MKNKKAKSLILPIVIGLVVILLIGGGIYYFMQIGAGGVDKVEAESEDGFAKLTATFYDFSGDALGKSTGVEQALIGGKNKRTHVSFQLSATNTGNVDLTNVQVTSPNANMNGAFDNIGALSSLAVSASQSLGSTDQTCTSTAGCDTNEECCEVGVGCGSVNGVCVIALDAYASADAGATNNIDFSISLKGDYQDAQGTSQSVTSSPVILTYDIRGEACTDGTTINSCVFDRTGTDADKPKYCSFVEGTAPSIIDKASVCGCPTNYVVDGESCVLATCTDQGETWDVGECSTLAHENNYGAYFKCTGIDTWIAACNECGATLDANGGAITGCSAGTDPSSAVYQSYSGNLSGTLSE